LAKTTTIEPELGAARTQGGPATPAASISSPDTRNPPGSPWIYNQWLDLLVGCGAWSAPLLALSWLAPSQTHGWVVAFYALAVVFNYPHFMATIYRAYHTRADFERYKFFTLHVTLVMAATIALLHASYALLPWVFTLYICWSPWHYSGQNYGLLMMFARRSGAAVTTAERQWIRAAFIASYLMLLASFETGGSTDPLILSLGWPERFTLWARVALGIAFLVCSGVGFDRLIRRGGLRAMVAPITLAFTQFLWFVLPTLLELHSTYHVPQTRYSSGILAVLHSAQYLWITSYYQQREARAANQSNWKMAAYFATLIAGGIALFIPGPWILSRLLHFDFTTSFLIFTAVVNIHHFILDGALWKLRDSRIASLLIDRRGAKDQASGAAPDAATAAGGASPKTATNAPVARPLWLRIARVPTLRISLLVMLLVWGVLDQIHFALRTNASSLSSLADAERMNPYDSAVEAEIGLADAKAGKKGEEIAAFERAVGANPHNQAVQEAYARALIEGGRFEDAYTQYGKMLEIFPRDESALVNCGLLAARFDHLDQAVQAWQRAADVDPGAPNAHLYLASAYDHKGDVAAASDQWAAYLRGAAIHPDDPAAGIREVIPAEIQLADDEVRLSRRDAAVTSYESAIALAQRAGDARLQSLALAHLAELQETGGDVKAAASAYQRALALDANAGDARGAASDWFNYGQFLRRQKLPDELAYACFLHAEELLGASGGGDLAAVKQTRQQVEGRLGNKTAAARKDLPTLLARANSLPASSF
jgi:tetratricopeptide (TPR) repeat protein